jgi:cyclase
MLKKRIIPCLDVTNGRVVKGVNFVGLRDAGDPVDLAKRYNEEGADELVFLDITASSDKRGILIELVKKVASEIFIPFTVGGGIGDGDTIKAVLDAGADKVSINSAAVYTPTLIEESSKNSGSQCIVVAIDAKKVTEKDDAMAYSHLNALPKNVHKKDTTVWEVVTHGGRKRTGIDAIEWARFMAETGAGEILLTSMDADGAKKGYDIALTDAVSQAVRVPVIASGGAGNIHHIEDVLQVSDAALLASLLHFRELTIEQIKNHCHKKGIPVRNIIH